MIGYRFLSPAEEEMIQAALFYERRSAHLGVISSMMSIALSL
jgi:hypothetical protein